MAQFAFINGSIVPQAEATVSILDRGFLFADGIYEISAVVGGHLIDHAAHMARFERSLGEIRLKNPYSVEEWSRFGRDLIARNGLAEGILYMQVTRGAPAERDFAFPTDGTPPTALMFTQAKNILRNPMVETGAKIVTVPDLRWKRRDIKSVSMLAQVLAKQAAIEAGAFEAWMIEDGYVTEGSATTAFIITRGDKIVTRPLSHAVLPGITRQSLLRLAEERALTIEERRFTVEEAHDAAEAFLTSATSFVLPIVAIDGRFVSDGRPGEMTRRLRQVYLAMACGSASLN
jgi:D-alanine transaminase